MHSIVCIMNCLGHATIAVIMCFATSDVYACLFSLGNLSGCRGWLKSGRVFYMPTLCFSLHADKQ